MDSRLDTMKWNWLSVGALLHAAPEKTTVMLSGNDAVSLFASSFISRLTLLATLHMSLHSFIFNLVEQETVCRKKLKLILVKQTSLRQQRWSVRLLNCLQMWSCCHVNNKFGAQNLLRLFRKERTRKAQNERVVALTVQPKTKLQKQLSSETNT